MKPFGFLRGVEKLLLISFAGISSVPFSIVISGCLKELRELARDAFCALNYVYVYSSPVCSAGLDHL